MGINAVKHYSQTKASAGELCPQAKCVIKSFQSNKNTKCKSISVFMTGLVCIFLFYIKLLRRNFQ